MDDADVRVALRTGDAVRIRTMNHVLRWRRPMLETARHHRDCILARMRKTVAA